MQNETHNNWSFFYSDLYLLDVHLEVYCLVIDIVFHFQKMKHSIHKQFLVGQQSFPASQQLISKKDKPHIPGNSQNRPFSKLWSHLMSVAMSVCFDMSARQLNSSWFVVSCTKPTFRYQRWRGAKYGSWHGLAQVNKHLQAVRPASGIFGLCWNKYII